MTAGTSDPAAAISGVGASLDPDASWLDRGLALVGGDPQEAERLGWLQVFFFFHVAMEILISAPWAFFAAPDALLPRGAFTYFYLPAGIGLSLAWSRWGSRPRLGRTLAWMFSVLAVLWLFPNLPNHLFLVVFCLTVLWLVDLKQDREAMLGLRVLRWTTIIVFAASGWQKVRYGTYFHAEFLTWAAAHTERFAVLMQPWIPVAEWRRIQALPPMGPFGSTWWPLVALSNGVWIFEVAAPLCLLHRRTRGPAVAAIIAFLVAIELGAREWMFGCVFVSLMLLFPRRNILPKVLPLFLLIYLAIFAGKVPAALGWGHWGFLPL